MLTTVLSNFALIIAESSLVREILKVFLMSYDHIGVTRVGVTWGGN